MERWFVLENNERVGPYDLSVLREKLIAGELALDAILVREGGVIQRKVIDVPEIFLRNERDSRVVAGENVNESFVFGTENNSTRVASDKVAEETPIFESKISGGTMVAEEKISFGTGESLALAKQDGTQASDGVSLNFGTLDADSVTIDSNVSPVEKKKSSGVREIVLQAPAASVVKNSVGVLPSELGGASQHPVLNSSRKAWEAQDPDWLDKEVNADAGAKNNFLAAKKIQSSLSGSENSNSEDEKKLKPSLPVADAVPIEIRKSSSVGVNDKKSKRRDVADSLKRNGILGADIAGPRVSSEKKEVHDRQLDLNAVEQEPMRTENAVEKSATRLRPKRVDYTANTKSSSSELFFIGVITAAVVMAVTLGVLIWQKVSGANSAKTETVMQIDKNLPMPPKLETPRVPSVDPAAAGGWGTVGQTESEKKVQNKQQKKMSPIPKSPPKPVPTKVPPTLPKAKSRKVGQKVQLSGVSVPNAPSQCSPCRIKGKLSDGTSVLLVSPNARLWNAANVKGSAQVSVKGTVIKVLRSEMWIFLQNVSAR